VSAAAIVGLRYLVFDFTAKSVASIIGRSKSDEEFVDEAVIFMIP
jgi:hypothetical protein